MNGVSPNDVIHISNPSARDRLKKVYKGTGGIIMSAHGADIVPLGETDKLNANHVLKVAKSFGRNRGISPETEPLRPFVENLGPAGDRSRVYAGERLLPKYFGKLVDGADVRSFFVEDYGDMAMSQQTHSAMVDLARSGVSMSWESPTGPRVFHRSGLWIGREDIARFENLEMIVAMYGTHRKAIDEKLEPKLRLFFEEMTKIVPAYGLGFIHGNGPGLMRMTDVMARAVKAMSVAIGILVEGQDEGDDIWLPQAVAHFMDGSRLYRQQSMDKKRLVTVINPGGDGTIEESGITKCSDKLHQIIPGPTVVVDPPGNYFTGLIQMFAQASERKKIDMWGEEVDITETPFAQPWVTNTVHHVQNYTPPETEEGKVEAYETAKKSSTLDPRSATEIIKEFYETPAKYWEKAKIPEREIAKAFKIHTKELGEMGMHLASRFELAAKEYTA
jgi:predicted Rossmann-fold nucleotide-binding protein